MCTILPRIQEIVAAEGITIGAMERSIGASKGVLSRALSNGTDVQSKWIQKVVENYPRYSAEWLLTGKGPMLKSTDEEQEPVACVIENPETTTIGQPYYDVDFLGGFDPMVEDNTTVPAKRIFIEGINRVDLWCNVTGHSMEPQISHGDIIGLRSCNVEDILYGETYAVVLDGWLEGIRTIKILRKGSSPGMLRYVPVNANYDEQEFPIQRITHIYEVIGAVKKFF